jgi:hypothetical protein
MGTGSIPSERIGHSAIVYEQEMYIFGGADITGFLNDLHKYNFGI